MQSRYVLILLITILALTAIACQTDQDAGPTEVPAIPTATDASTQPAEETVPAEGEEDYPAPAEQETLPTPESYPEPTEDTS